MQAISPCRFGSQFNIRMKFTEAHNSSPFGRKEQPYGRYLGDFVSQDLQSKLGIQNPDISDIPHFAGPWGHLAWNDDKRIVSVSMGYDGGTTIVCPDQYDDLVRDSIDTFISLPADDPRLSKQIAPKPDDVSYTVEKRSDFPIPGPFTGVTAEECYLELGFLEAERVQCEIKLAEMDGNREKIMRKLFPTQ